MGYVRIQGELRKVGDHHRDRGLGDPWFSPRDTGSAPTNAMRVLEERFARGEIDADEFQRRRDILRCD
jgi:hypothetical protein